MGLNVAILGASQNAKRYANMAQRKLVEAGHQVFPVSRDGGEIMGLSGVSSLSDIEAQVHTITVYLRPAIFCELLEEVIACGPERVIFNPGAEARQCYPDLEQANIRIIEACTLVLLSVDKFESA